jgi:hypothetical protein
MELLGANARMVTLAMDFLAQVNNIGYCMYSQVFCMLGTGIT